MLDTDIRQRVPEFILNDKNGYALAMAIERGMTMLRDTIMSGVGMVLDTENMPEWRLDELAWEYNIPYDYDAHIDIKREWIARAIDLSRLHGTPEGIRQYMNGVFDDTEVLEAWDYGGEPYHFRMAFPGSWTPEKVAWATAASETVKNVRSILDRYTFRGRLERGVTAGCAFYAQDTGRYAIDRRDVPALDCYADESGQMLLDENGYPMIAEG